ncbi:major facilitator superfamily domain-containing protein 6-like isoform X2 [Bacillus rossius redtenbacheri]
MYSVLPILRMVSKPLFGFVADRFRLQKTLFLVFQTIVMMCFFFIQFIPEIPKTTHISLDCDALTYIKKCNGGPVDDNMFGKLKAEGAITCQTVCVVDNAQFMGEMCAQWRTPQFCDPVIHLDPNTSLDVNFQSFLLMEHSVQVKNCLFFRVNKVVFDDSTEHTPYCSNLTSIPCTVHCSSMLVNDIIADAALGSSMLALPQFWALLVVLSVSMIAIASVTSVGDAICFSILGDKRNRYGYQRMWGAVGWGLMAIIAGLLVDAVSGLQVEKNYSPIFYMSAIFLLFDMLASGQLKYSQPAPSGSIVHDVKKLLIEPRIIVLLVWCVCVGLSSGFIRQFLFWHLEDLSSEVDQRWMKTLEGLLVGVQCFGGELPFFFLSGYILKKLGHVHAMSLVLLGYGIRFLLYASLSNPWWFLPVEMLQGITYGIFYSTMVSYASVVAPRGAETTVQGLVTAVHEGVGMSLGNLLGGVLYESYGGGQAFFIYSIMSIAIFFVHVFAQIYLKSPNLKVTENDYTAHYAAPKDAISIGQEMEEIH